MDKTCRIFYTRLDEEGLSIVDSIKFSSHEGTVRTVCTTTEEQPKIITAGQDNFLKVWDCTTGRNISKIRGFHSHVALR